MIRDTKFGQHALAQARAFGYLKEAEVFALYVLAGMLEGEHPSIVNIGAGSGTSSLALREGCQRAVMFTVDISTGGPLGGMENEQNAFANTGLALPNEILGDSHNVGHQWRGGRVDCIFVDADHTTPGIIGDIAAWWPHLKPGGYMAFHDVDSPHWKDVRPAVEKHIADSGAELIFWAETLWVVKKTK
jgi:predicted O-methyltransferase YrrM